MTKTIEKTLARALQAARGDGAFYQRALTDIRDCTARGDDPVAFALGEGAVVRVPLIAWQVSPPTEEDEPLVFALVQAPEPVLLATLADDDDAPAVEAAGAVRRVGPVAGLVGRRWAAGRVGVRVLVGRFGWEVTLEPFGTRVAYSLCDDPLVMGARLREAVDRGCDRATA